MADAVLRVPALPVQPLDAAAKFNDEIVAAARDYRRGRPDHSLVIVFEPAGHEHRCWRLAAIQELAREAAPAGRVNGIVGDDERALSAAIRYLERAPGITGQLLAIDGTGAGEVLSNQT